MNLEDALETLALLPDWEQRYTYVIELARQLPAMAEADKVAANLVPGCTSQVWLATQWDGDELSFAVDSDALIVRGLMALVWLAYNGKTASEIQSLDLEALLAPTQLLGHLSPNRRNGFVSVVKRIHQLAHAQA